MRVLCLFFTFIIVLFSNACVKRNSTITADTFDTYVFTDELSPYMQFESLLYQADNTIFLTVDDSAFDARIYIEKNVEQVLRVSLFDQCYILEYQNTVNLPLVDLIVHVYKSNDTSVFVDSKSGKIVKYINFSYTSTGGEEEEYTDFIKACIEDQIEYSAYDYSCTTHYYSFSDFGMESKVVEGFKKCGDNEKIGTYSFYFTKSISDIKTLEHISAEFFGDRFSLEIYHLGYSEAQFENIFETINNIEISVEEYLKGIVKIGYKITDTKMNSCRLFVKDDVPYVLSSVTVTFFVGEGTEEYTEMVDVISKQSNDI